MPSSILHNKQKLAITRMIEKKSSVLGATLKTNLEAFRSGAAEAYESFTDDDRKLCRKLQTETTKIQHVLDTWKESLQPSLEKIEAKRHDRTLKQVLEKELYFSSPMATKKINELLAASKENLLQNAITHLFPTDWADKISDLDEKRQVVTTFLLQDTQIIESFYQRFVDYTAYMRVAQTEKITIYDSMSSWLERQRTLGAIKKEQQKTLQQLRDSTAHLQTEIKSLLTAHDSLLNTLIARDWQVAELCKLFEMYQKKCNALPKKEQQNPAKQFAIFETTTRRFREAAVIKISTTQKPANLIAARRIADDVDQLVLRFFDLPSNQKTTLLKDAQAHEKLTQELARLESETHKITLHLAKK